MCGRYNLRATPYELKEFFELFREPASFPPRYNIAPTQTVLAIRQDSSGRVAAPLRWGLIPSWAKDPRQGVKMINARAETVLEKPTYKASFRRRRCLIPASGFYEWRAGLGKTRVPYHIHRPNDGLIAFAGLWDRWERGAEPIESCTIITTTANELMQPLHDRMPVILSPADWGAWLDPEVDEGALAELLRPAREEDLIVEAASPLVNNVRNETAACLTPPESSE